MIYCSYQTISAQALIKHLNFKKSILCFEKIYLDEDNLNEEIKRLFNIKNLPKTWAEKYWQLEADIDYLFERGIVAFCNTARDFMEAEIDVKTRKQVQAIKKDTELDALLEKVDELHDDYEKLTHLPGIIDEEHFLTFNSGKQELLTYWSSKIHSQLYNTKICTLGVDGNILAMPNDILWIELHNLYTKVKQPSENTSYEQLLEVRELNLFDVKLQYNYHLQEYRSTPPADVIVSKINAHIGAVEQSD